MSSATAAARLGRRASLLSFSRKESGMKRRLHNLALSALFLLSFGAAVAQTPGAPWKFVVGGDSRNCGDVVMPAVAAGAVSEGAAFYWHLGDFRALYDFDADLLQARRTAGETKPLAIADYQKAAWDDFLQSQIAPFGPMP